MKKKRWILQMLVMFISLVGYSINVTADTNTNEGMSFSMTIVPPENQINTNSSYFDLKVSPNDRQELTVIVSNTGSELKHIRVTPTDATTNQNGVIDYSIKEAGYQKDDTLLYPLSSIVSEAQVVEVLPGEERKVNFQLTVPNETIEGLILGGFVADLPEVGTDTSSEKSIMITNKIQVVKAIMIRQQEEKVKPNIVMNQVIPTLVGYRTAVTANLQNTAATMIGEMTIEAEVRKKGSDTIVRKETKSGLEMAPNSSFDFPIMWSNQPLEPGTYVLNLEASSRGDTWGFEEEFTIDREESSVLNEEAVELIEPEGLPVWVYIVIGILVFVVLLLLLLLSKRSKKTK